MNSPLYYFPRLHVPLHQHLGKIVWQHFYQFGFWPKKKKNSYSSCLPLWKGVFIWRNRGRDGVWCGCHVNDSFFYFWTCPSPRVTAQTGHAHTGLCISAAQPYKSHSSQNKASKLISPWSQTLLGGGKRSGLKHKPWHRACCAALSNSALSCHHTSLNKSWILPDWKQKQVFNSFPHQYWIQYLNLDLKKLLKEN